MRVLGVQGSKPSSQPSSVRSVEETGVFVLVLLLILALALVLVLVLFSLSCAGPGMVEQGTEGGEIDFLGYLDAMNRAQLDMFLNSEHGGGGQEPPKKK